MFTCVYVLLVVCRDFPSKEEILWLSLLKRRIPNGTWPRGDMMV